MQVFGCQQVLLHSDNETKAIIEYLCHESNSLYNCSVYYARQIWFKTGKIVSGFDLTAQMKNNKHFHAGYASAMQQTCLSVGEAFKSFKQLLAKSKKGELNQKPRVPNYRKPGGLFTVTYPKKWLKLVDNLIRFPLGNQVKAWFGITEFFLPMPSNLEWSDMKEIRILPRNRQFYAEFVYQTEKSIIEIDKSKVIGIDHGIDNWLTCVSNVGTSFIIDGLHLKSLNQWYNKTVANIKEGKPQGFWSNRLAAITEKRNRQMRNAVNKAARIVINHCIDNKIGTIVFGWNQRQKDSADLGKKNNQKFVQIPTAKLKGRIAQLCEQSGIVFVETEESYTSKTSFLDNDVLPTFGAKPEGWKSSGIRITRGQFRTSTGIKINADCNGAVNIIKKVAAIFKFDLSGVGRGALSAPKKVLLWTLQKSPRLQTGES
ncbi:transposase [Dolichospermum sp. UHCC 0684]|uniref:IS200/IS605 family element transposase accessory protein TnpB n=1 Tax=Dolichospermum flos-aquae CCAP 1403/13F TaxID=315271 RepID=A0A6H2C7I2_DOLFA|nr:MULTISPECIES: RNA-guided endonuclease TnpB family protein [Dolichospermum]MDB9437185.1 transposase [Dolichospermum lemmermannii CS-548]MEA5529876.1 transposase [Dolichospermum sp. UHCC 0684]MTJ36501.1 IS200/IS605 family element transposase accessory protein TnpB [Dolichospermum sp. UHCC 0260]QJB47118.1 IS200/IS605 family element transposase accessory protein TnpB [Dolichospermum flos-aquae CCAP 1403/13F]